MSRSCCLVIGRIGVAALVIYLAIAHYYYVRLAFFKLIPEPPVDIASPNSSNKTACTYLASNSTGYCSYPSLWEPSIDFSKKQLLDAAASDDQNIITAYIRSVYFARVRQQFVNMHAAGGCKPKYVYYSCDPAKIARAPGQFKGCCGLGDRLRGVISSFYMALLTDSVFMMDWVHPLPISSFFHVNSELYYFPNELKPADVETQEYCLAKSGNFAYLNMVQDEGRSQTIISSNELLNTLANDSMDGMMMTLNSLAPLEKLLSKELRDAFGDLVEAYHLRHFTYTQLVSAALSIVFAHPKPQLQWQIDNIFAKTLGLGTNNRSKGQTIGVQLRFNVPRWSEPTRVRVNQTFCFLQEIKRIIKDYNLTFPTVYLTGDNYNEVTKLFKMIKTEGIPVTRSPDKTPHHIDLVKESEDSKTTWFKVASVFREWLLLSRFDYLIISRSSFSETASLLTRRKTRRFNHKMVKSCLFEDYGVLNTLGMEGF